jgi:drug/metabolite transporter (DMT)-like permease
MRTDPRYTAKLVSCLAAVYLIWGSSFMFSKIAVTHLPIALYSAVRFLTAGTVLALVARYWKGDAWPRRAVDWRHTATTGFFMVFVSNGLNAWSIQYLPTNLTALLNGSSAFWIAGLGTFGRRGHPLSRLAIIGLTVGFAGTALVLMPGGRANSVNVPAEFGVLAACLAFSLGTLYYRSVDTTLGSLMFMALQLLVGGLMLLAIAVLHGDASRWTFNAPGMIALGFQTFVSSCLAFTAYGWLTRNATPSVIGTYSYVNPAIAAYLGWQFMQERLSGVQLAGMIVIIAAVSLLTLPGGSNTDPKTLAEPKAQ